MFGDQRIPNGADRPGELGHKETFPNKNQARNAIKNFEKDGVTVEIGDTEYYYPGAAVSHIRLERTPVE